MSRALRNILSLSAPEAAPLLLGWELVAGDAGGRIVEVEAYTMDDPASHSYGGQTRRNLPMFLEGGHIYVYRSYGVHWCLNIVTGLEGDGQAVLVRALEPTFGIDTLQARRPGVSDRRLCAGPGNLAKALGLTGADSGSRIGATVDLRPGRRPEKIVAGPRIGVSRAIETPWRFCDAGSRCLSRRATGHFLKKV